MKKYLAIILGILMLSDLGAVSYKLCLVGLTFSVFSDAISFVNS